MCVGCFLHVCLHAVCAQQCPACVQYPQTPEEGAGPVGTGVLDGCGPHVGARNQKLGPLHNHPQHLSGNFFKIFFY